MAQHIVGVAELRAVAEPESMLVTFSLGSCIGLAIYDPVVRVGGLLHYMLPDSSIDAGKACKSPAMFADTGIPLLFKTAYTLGLKKNRARILVAGGAQILDESGHFNIGKRNYAALRNIFWKNNVLIDAEDVGGSVSRSLFLDLATGRAWVKYGRENIRIFSGGL
ncbi:MAG: chemotaxis protein CheD [bacterium]